MVYQFVIFNNLGPYFNSALLLKLNNTFYQLKFILLKVCMAVSLYIRAHQHA